MKPLYCEYTIDRSKVIFYYTADDRVDFRDLLKVLTPEFAMRVELRQIGPREAARCVGGLGSCGRPLCCATHLRGFQCGNHENGQRPANEFEYHQNQRSLR